MNTYEFTIERPNGSTYKQLHTGATMEQARKDLQRIVGKPYYVCYGGRKVEK